MFITDGNSLVTIPLMFVVKSRHPEKSAYSNIVFFISQPKHMLWVLKRTVSMRRFLLAPITHVLTVE